jgi:hypothetical protein
MNLKQTARWTGAGVSIASVLFAIGTYLGVLNEWRGDNLLADVATRFDSSYSQDAGRPVRPGDEAWPVVMRVIKKYSHAQLLPGREPRVLARFVAVAAQRKTKPLTANGLRRQRRSRCSTKNGPDTASSAPKTLCSSAQSGICTPGCKGTKATSIFS